MVHTWQIDARKATITVAATRTTPAHLGISLVAGGHTRSTSHNFAIAFSSLLVIMPPISRRETAFMRGIVCLDRCTLHAARECRC